MPLIKFLVVICLCWAWYALGKHNGGLRECRMQFTTVDTAPAVWEHCERRFAFLRRVE